MCLHGSSPRSGPLRIRLLAGLVLSILVSATGPLGCSPASIESPVLAIVNGRPITLAEFDVRWSELSAATRTRYEREGGKRKFLDDLISRELLMQEARKRGLNKSPSLRHRVQRFQEKLLLDSVMEHVIEAHDEVDQQELDAFYALHGAVLPAPDRIELAQIVSTNVYAAKDIKRMLEEGVRFESLARRYSADQYTKAQGGYVGVYRKGSAPPEVEDVIYKLRPGRISQPIKTGSGYYLVRVLSRRPGDIKEVLAARERLKQELKAEKGRKNAEAYLADLRSSASIRIGEASKYVTDDLSSLRGGPAL